MRPPGKNAGHERRHRGFGERIAQGDDLPLREMPRKNEGSVLAARRFLFQRTITSIGTTWLIMYVPRSALRSIGCVRPFLSVARHMTV